MYEHLFFNRCHRCRRRRRYRRMYYAKLQFLCPQSKLPSGPYDQFCTYVFIILETVLCVVFFFCVFILANFIFFPFNSEIFFHLFFSSLLLILYQKLVFQEKCTFTCVNQMIAANTPRKALSRDRREEEKNLAIACLYAIQLSNCMETKITSNSQLTNI